MLIDGSRLMSGYGDLMLAFAYALDRDLELRVLRTTDKMAVRIPRE
ncbi:MAG: hypothetical protein JOZ50_00715 [Candidatus Eremiobacteraeota bacterium]|nr:hypothetical protein [Candidatus Eremiobacteraeota bacterium]MBV8594749.1 hypothetical protein [Candidatus Eremiobacteraeota bacterium]